MSGHFTPLVRTALNPLIALSCAGMAAGGGFVAYEGHWSSLIIVALVFFSNTLFFPFLMVPAALFGNVMKMFQSKPFIAHVFQALSVGWLIFVMSLWGALVFDTVSTSLPVGGVLTTAALVWAVSGATAPWGVFASNDRDNVFFTGLVLMLWAGAITAAVIGGGDEVSFWARCGTIAGVMAGMAAIEAVYESLMVKKKT